MPLNFNLSEEEAFGLQFAHGLGVALYEPPMISRLHSLEHPIEIEEGMVFAIETYCPASDGYSAARIEEEVVVTADGVRIITRFPADELIVAGTQYVRGADLVENGTPVIGPSGIRAARPAAAGVMPSSDAVA